MKEQITELLYDLGIAPNIKGFKYLRDAITFTVEKPEMLDGITKDLYPEVAKTHKTTSSRVERAMRHAIEVSFDKLSPDKIAEVFKNTVDPNRGRPTNSEFVALLSERIRMGCVPVLERS